MKIHRRIGGKLYNAAAPQMVGAPVVVYQTPYRYVDRQTIPLTPTASLTTDQQQSAFQLPFGISVSYKLLDNRYVKPYFGVKSGAMYSQNSIYNFVN